MRVIGVQSAQALARAGADWVQAHVRAEPHSALALPTGRTPLGLYAELIKRSRGGELSLADAHIFNLDEFCGLPLTDPHSFAAFLHRHLIEPLRLPAHHVRLLRGEAPAPEAECLAYDAALAACGGLDLAILGLGANGHIAFNEPGDAWDQRTHVAELSAATRASVRVYSEDAWDVPARGLTMGIRTLFESRHILLLIAGANKRAARDALHGGVIDAAWPVTHLLEHPSLTTLELCEPVAGA